MSTTSHLHLDARANASKLVEQAKKFSIRLPGGRKVPVPPPDQLAFYGALGLLAAVNVLDWPVALAIGVGQAVLTRHLADRPVAESEQEGAKESAQESSNKKGDSETPPRKSTKAPA